MSECEITKPVSAEDRRFMEQALELAMENVRLGRGGPFGAVLVEEGRVLSEGVNQVVLSTDPTAHAEVVAIRRASATSGRFHLPRCTLYTSCEPCPMCLSAAYWAQIPRIVYGLTRLDAERMGFSDAEIYREVALAPGERRTACEHLPVPAGEILVSEWNGKADRVQY